MARNGQSHDHHIMGITRLLKLKGHFCSWFNTGGRSTAAASIGPGHVVRGYDLQMAPLQGLMTSHFREPFGVFSFQPNAGTYSLCLLYAWPVLTNAMANTNRNCCCYMYCTS